jgi:3-hydroxyacyl-CoA dehydrogenase / enoyl-CoA hydratase / 3-hydroxybutyryl-CoA epimerase
MIAQRWSVLRSRELELGPTPAPSVRSANWCLKRDADNIAWLLLDRTGESVNTLSEAVLSELDDLLDALIAEPPKGLVLRSGKPSGFIAGADIRDFRGMEDGAELKARLEAAHALLNKLDSARFPTVAVIHGFCLGGGLELALACACRIAVQGATLGFPEIKLGLHPGLGGTARLTRLIDPIEAMKMMLTGRTVSAPKAKLLGLVDLVTPERHVRAAASAALAGRLKRSRRGLRAAALYLVPARRLAARTMRAQAQEKARPEHYPAPYALIDLWDQNGGDQEAMLQQERESFGALLVGKTAQNLVRAFFLRDKLKKLADEDRDLRHAHVVGGGVMGGDIAAWCALKGLRVTIYDPDRSALAKTAKRAGELFAHRIDDAGERRDALDRLLLDFENQGVAQADIVIEAAPERLDLKHKLFEAIEPRLKEGSVLATNTSSIPLERLREALRSPERLVGLHFFNPVASLELVELVRHDRASNEALARARAFCGRIDRLPAPVKSAPGFLVNRALAPYLFEALTMLGEGVKPETIDAAAERFGMPMGPIEVADRVGLDICLDVADALKGSLELLPEAPAWLRDKVNSGELGRKSGRGLYDYAAGKPKKRMAPEPDEQMIDRLVLPLVNACAECLRKGVTDDEDTVDAAMIFGVGFAPFRGGPLHYARTRGIDNVVEALQNLAKRHGPRFAPDERWSNLGRRFDRLS